MHGQAHTQGRTGVDHQPGIVQRCRKRLLADDIDTRLGAHQHQRLVRRGRCRDVDKIQFLLAQHGLRIGIGRRVRRMFGEGR